MVSLFTNVPTAIASIRATIPNHDAVIYLRQVCRGTYCVACEDSTATCIRAYVVGMNSQTGYTANVTSIRRDVLYSFVPTTGADCAPVVTGLSAEYVTDNTVVVSSAAVVNFVRVECVSDASKFLNIPVEAV